MFGIEVNPFDVEVGDKLATKTRKTWEGPVVLKSREVKGVMTCPTQPECRHIDGECYDARFTTLVIADDKKEKTDD